MRTTDDDERTERHRYAHARSEKLETDSMIAIDAIDGHRRGKREESEDPASKRDRSSPLPSLSLCVCVENERADARRDGRASFFARPNSQARTRII